MDLNKAMIIGNMTQDPEVKTTPSGQSVVNFSIATNLVWVDESGQKKEKAEFHNIVAWRKLADIIGQYLKKGSKVYIEGRLQTRSWEDKDTSKKMYRTEIIADNMIMLDRKGTTSTNTNEEVKSVKTNDYSQPEPQTNNQTSNEDEINVDDIPF